MKEKGILIHDLAIVEPNAEGPHAELLTIEEVLLECPTDWKNLVQRDLPVRRVTIRRATLRNTHRPRGGWSAVKLLPPPHFGEHPPEVVVEGGLIEIFDPLKTPASTLALRNVNLSLMPVPMTEPGAKGDVRRLKGMLTGDSFRRVEFEGLVDLAVAELLHPRARRGVGDLPRAAQFAAQPAGRPDPHVGRSARPRKPAAG